MTALIPPYNVIEYQLLKTLYLIILMKNSYDCKRNAFTSLRPRTQILSKKTYRENKYLHFSSTLL
jgi:hypothetical protein